MSEVVLRCPHCGTVQATAGECETCHKGEVRFFCPNHAPGRWLDGPLCEGCGATTEQGPLTPVELPPLRPPLPRRPLNAPRVGAGGEGRSDWWEADKPTDAAGATAPLLGAPLRVSTPPAAAHAIPARPTTDEPERVQPRRRVLGGPLVLLLLVVLIGVGAVAAVWIVRGGPSSGWLENLGQSTAGMLGTPAQTQRGIDAYRRGDRAVAQRELEQAVRSYRRSATALLYLAQMRVDAGDLPGAAPYLDEAIAREPDNSTVRRMMGEYHLTFAQAIVADTAQRDAATSHLELAEDHLSYAVSLDGSDRRARGYLACVLAALGRGDEARAAHAEAGAGPWDRCTDSAARRLVPGASPM